MKLLRLSFQILLIACLFNISACSQSTQSISGIDISRYQGKVDFEKIKSAGTDYIFIRATEGNTYQDGKFQENIIGARKAGLIIGAYHFYETNDAPSTQFKNFTSIVTLKQGDLSPVVDIEKLHQHDDANLIANLKTFLNALEQHYGSKPIIYTGLNFANAYIEGFTDYPLWLAEYEKQKPVLPKGWNDWTFWQHSQTGKVNGIEGDVDLDVFNGDLAAFNKLLIQ